MGLSSSLCIEAFIFLCCFGLSITSVFGIYRNETDRLALLDFKAKITLDPLGVMSSWNDSIHFCQWQGVTCGRRHQRVTKLDLQSQSLVGSISSHVGNLSFLRQLILANNSFIHAIPPEVGRLHRLQNLRLENNSISGQFPSNISSCTNLISIMVSYNQLVGEIPVQLTTLSKLQEFSIGKNNLSGNIPPSFGNLSSLEIFIVAGNNLGGNTPESFGQLTKLTFFSATENRLSGTIPPSIFNLSSMQIFSVSENQIRGTLPWDLGITLPNLQGFGITTNQFTGSIPVSISNASYLSALYLESNMLTGIVPSLEKLHRLEALGIDENLLGNGGGDDLSFLCSLTNATYLRKLAIDHNNLGGLLPDCISNFSTTLSFLRLNYNKITGGIPTGLTNLINLEVLLAGNNELSGTIPFDLGNLGKLVYLDLSDNNFIGSIPSSLGNLGLVVQVYLGGNKLHGKIPHTLAKCQNLLFLNLSRNNLSGIVPSEVIGLSSSLVGVDLSVNLFTGVLPMEIGNLKNLQFLYVSENLFSGEIPASIGSCVRLEYLSLGRNFFHGHIPSSLESLRGIESLVLSHNNLSGEIPKFLERFTFLELLDLSFNHFEGEVPVHGVFNDTNATRIEGNNKLCGGVSEFQLPKCEIKKSTKKTTKLTLILKFVIPLLFALLGVTLILLFLLCCFRKKRKETTSSSGNLLLNVSYQSLLKATDGFSSANLVGMGSFGSVYKGVLDQGTRTVAVKVLNLLHHGASKSFIAECQALRNIRHRNLVNVLTACSSVDYQGHDFKALIYEFMGNGNLDEWLHSTLRANEVFQEQRNLSLLQRLNIAIDIASALEYLHHQCETPIVHCDLKPSNVLLDDEMNARVGDFGLARFLLEHTQDCSTNQSSSIGVRGTMGYAAPEYGLGNEVSTYGDVYSYGILLLEMFTGKKPTNHMLKDGFTLHDFVRVGLQEQLVYIVDPILLSKGGGETMLNHVDNQSPKRSSKISECVSLIMRVGVSCSMDVPSKRMNIGDAVTELHSIRRKLLGTSTRRESLGGTQGC